MFDIHGAVSGMDSGATTSRHTRQCRSYPDDSETENAYKFSSTSEPTGTPSITASHYTLDEVLHLASQREQQEIDHPDAGKPNRLLLLDEVNRDAGIMTMLERIKESQLVEQRETRNPSSRRRFSNISPIAPPVRHSRVSKSPMVNRITFDGVERTITLSQPRRYVLSTTSSGHRLWQILITITAVLSGVFVPLLSSGLLKNEVEMTSVMYSLELICDVVFFADIVVNFRTSYEDQVRDIFVTSPRHIAQRYACSWLAIDLMHSLPYANVVDMFTAHERSDNLKYEPTASLWTKHIIFSLRMLKTLRLLRLMFPRYPTINRLNSVIHPSSLVLCRLIIDLSFVWHITACIYIYTCSIGYNPALEKTEASFFFQQSMPWLPPPNVQNTTEAMYIYSVWWAIGVSCSIYRPEPQTYSQLIFSLCVTVAGIFLMTLLIGSLTTAIAEIQSINNQTTYKLQIIARYMHAKKLPQDLRARILSYYRFLLLSMNVLDESSVLPGLPRALRMQVSFMVHEPGFVKLSMFWVLKAEEIYFLCQRLKPCILLILDQIIKEGRVGIGLCIVEKGQVEVTRRGEFVTLLPDSTAFGENALEGKASKVTVRASRYCELAILLTSDYHDLISLNPGFTKYLKMYVSERDSKHLNPDMKAMALKAVVASSRTKIVHGWTQPASDMDNMIAWQRAAQRTQLAASITKRFSNVCEAVRQASSRGSSRGDTQTSTRASNTRTNTRTNTLPTPKKPNQPNQPNQLKRHTSRQGSRGIRGFVEQLSRDSTRTGRLRGVGRRQSIKEWSKPTALPTTSPVKSQSNDTITDQPTASKPATDVTIPSSAEPRRRPILKPRTSFSDSTPKSGSNDGPVTSLPMGPLTRRDSQLQSQRSQNVPKPTRLPTPAALATSASSADTDSNTSTVASL